MFRRRTKTQGPLLVGRKLVLALVMLAVAAASASTGSPPAAAGAAEPEELTRARAIRAEVDARYRRLPGRKLVVGEVTTTAVVETLTLVSDWLEPRVVPADDGIYFAICPLRARCPYPARAAGWHALAFLPRRQALELAFRTLTETPASLVVVALPTAEPVWVVFEREVLAGLDAPTVLQQLGSARSPVEAPLRELVDRLTRPRLFAPLAVLPPPTGTIYAVPLPRG